MAGRMVPKGHAAQANVRDITSAKGGGGGGSRGGRQRGRPTGLGYDPESGEEVRGPTYHEEATRESTSETDVFTLVDKRGYSEERFYTRSLNADGHGERLNVRMPQGLDSQIHAAVAEIPQYRSTHDLVRDAIVHRLEFLQKRYELGDDARRTLELERMLADRERRSQETDVMQGAVDDLTVKLEKLYNRKDWAMLAEEFEQSGEMLDWLREPYRGQAAGVLGEWKSRAKDQIQKMRDALE